MIFRLLFIAVVSVLSGCSSTVQEPQHGFKKQNSDMQIITRTIKNVAPEVKKNAVYKGYTTSPEKSYQVKKMLTEIFSFEPQGHSDKTEYINAFAAEEVVNRVVETRPVTKRVSYKKKPTSTLKPKPVDFSIPVLERGDFSPEKQQPVVIEIED